MAPRASTERDSDAPPPTRSSVGAAGMAFLIGVLALAACSPGDSSCTPGRSLACACPGGGSGVQTCLADRTFGACVCGPGGEASTDVVAVDTVPPDTALADVVDAITADAITMDAIADLADSPVDTPVVGAEMTDVGDTSVPDALLLDAASDVSDGGGSDGAPPVGVFCGLPVRRTLAAGLRPLFSLGLAGPPQDVQRTPARVLTVEYITGSDTKHWILWNAMMRVPVAEGEFVCPVPGMCFSNQLAELRGDTLAIQPNWGADPIELRSATDGSLLASTVGGRAALALSADGSYLARFSLTNVTVFSRSGAMRWTRPGSYTSDRSRVFAAPTVLRVNDSPSTIENLDAATGARTTASFVGTFVAWTGDGSHFVTDNGATVYVYAPDGTRELILPIAASAVLGGYGNYLVLQGSGLNGIYDIRTGGVALPRAGLVSGSMVFIGPGTGTPPFDFEVVQIGAGGLSSTRHTSRWPSVGGFYADTTGRWLV